MIFLIPFAGLVRSLHNVYIYIYICKSDLSGHGLKTRAKTLSTFTALVNAFQYLGCKPTKHGHTVSY